MGIYLYHHLVLWLWNAFIYLRHPRLCRAFYRKKRFFPNVAWPKGVEEKYLWRKIFDHNPLFVRMQDKLGAKAYARGILPDIGLPETYWSGTDIADCPKALLAAPGLLKANHSCGRFLFLPASNLRFRQIKRRTDNWLKHRYGERMGEWAYQHITPKVFIERKLENQDGSPLDEIKVHVCSGKAVVVACFHGRHGEDPSVMPVTPDGIPIISGLKSPLPTKITKVNPHFNEAVRVAEHLAADVDTLRVDLYVVDGKIYVGEFTVYPLSGFTSFDEPTVKQAWAQAWDLRKSWFLTQPQSGWRAVYARALLRVLMRQADRESRIPAKSPV